MRGIAVYTPWVLTTKQTTAAMADAIVAVAEYQWLLGKGCGHTQATRDAKERVSLFASVLTTEQEAQAHEMARWRVVRVNQQQ